MQCKWMSLTPFLLVSILGAIFVKANMRPVTASIPTPASTRPLTSSVPVSARSVDGSQSLPPASPRREFSNSTGLIIGGLVGGFTSFAVLGAVMWSRYHLRLQKTPVVDTNSSGTTDSELGQLPKYQQLDPNQGSGYNSSGANNPELDPSHEYSELPPYTQAHLPQYDQFTVPLGELDSQRQQAEPLAYRATVARNDHSLFRSWQLTHGR
ncbi:hypothetical protein QBC36DRAFT_309486 [Triangularia setosa]|uniref:Transmembrane protein n=1 Tax=Triangularia setosa TaxID=2587417 RepID=A0AAN6WAC2_9PEZI|nr:hypothetical protein QBC36DRAFT_309486 [Podospora setosa]